MFSFQIGPVTSGFMSSLMGGCENKLTIVRKARCCCSLLLGSVMIRPWTWGSLLANEPGVFAILLMPIYSEWSVTPIKSSGVSILMS